MARRSKADAETTRLDILSAARSLFETVGFSETTIANICEKSGHTKGALFHHFSSKEDLFTDIWDLMEKEIDAAALQEALRVSASSEDPYAGFLAGCRVFVAHSAKPEFQQVIHIDGPVVLGMREWVRRDSALGLRNIGSALKMLSNQGLVREDKRHAFTALCYATLKGIAANGRAGEDTRVSTEELMEVFELFVRTELYK